MIDYPVEKETIMADHNQATLESRQIILQHCQGQNIEIISGLVENQEIRIPHENRGKVEPTPFPTTELEDEFLLCFGGEKKP